MREKKHGKEGKQSTECNGSVVFTWAACCVVSTTHCLLHLAQPRLLFQVRMSTEGDPESLDPAGNVGNIRDPM